MNKNLYNTQSKKELMIKLASEKFQRNTYSFYKYIEIKNIEQFRDILYIKFDKLNILGRIYIANEGINAQISIPAHNLSKFQSMITQIELLQNTQLKKAIEEGVAFYKLIIKTRNEIVAYGLPPQAYDMSKRGKHLNASQFNKALKDPNTIIVDMRNKYESEVGQFNNALLPEVETSKELLPKVTKMLEKNKEKQILLYCTGGIRCEKASAHLIKIGFKNVNQLKGGIVQYAHEVSEKKIKSEFIGKNFVFDARLGERITKDVISNCHTCNNPADEHTDCKNQICHKLFIQCASCSLKLNGCCSQKCKKITALPASEQYKMRKKGKR